MFHYFITFFILIGCNNLKWLVIFIISLLFYLFILRKFALWLRLNSYLSMC
nr:MAG TPA: hypothetical protein [Caudoviricetes sp.]